MDVSPSPILDADPTTPGASSRRRSPGALMTWTTTWFADNTLVASIGVLLLAFVMVFFWGKVFITIPAGHEGVIWRRLSGTDLETVFPEGTQIIFPWNVMTVYDLRLQRRDVDVTVLATDGLAIDVKLSVRFRPDAKTLPLLHSAVGPDYADRIVVPEVTTAVREVMGQYSPSQLYTIKTSEMEGRIIELAAKQIRDRYVGVDDVMITQITLPEIVQTAIQLKLRQDQEAQQYQYRLVEAGEEAERKREEATGIRDYEEIINEAKPSPATLLWRGIEATMELAKSPNAKVIVIGGHDGLPLILDASTLAASGVTAPSSGGTTPAPSSSAPGPDQTPKSAKAAPASGRGRGGGF